MNYLDAWQRFGCLTYSELPKDVVTVAHQCLLDWFGCALAGSREPLAGILREEYSMRRGACSVIGSKLRLDPATAALLNGASGHALDFDDTNGSVGCHATAPVIPAVLAIAEEIGATGAELITAFVVGVEVAGRVGTAIGVEHYRKGWHTTATYGTFGAAAGVAHLLRLDARRYAMAMGLAASAAAGVKANFGTMAKPLHAGQAAERGLNAARLAARGFTANPDAVCGNQGYIQAAGIGSANDARLVRLADAWLILDTLFKHHAACHLTHASIESLRRLRERVAPAEIASTTLTVNPDILNVCGIAEPNTGLEGKFSLRANAALTLLGEDTSDPNTYIDATIRRADVQAVLRRVRVQTDSNLSIMQSRVGCVDQAGNRCEELTDVGIPTRDLDTQGQRLRRKFERLSAPMHGAASGLADSLQRMGEEPSVAVLFEGGDPLRSSS